jgi:hypothetical protein
MARRIEGGDSDALPLGILGRNGRRRGVLVFVFLDFAAPGAAEEGAEETVEQVGDEKDGGHPGDVGDGDKEQDDGAEEFRERELGAEVETLEAGILEFAEHHEGEKDHERRQGNVGVTGGEFGLVMIIGDDDEGDGGDEAGGGGDGEAGEVTSAAAEVVGGGDVEAGEAEGTAKQIKAGDEPADLVRDVVEDDLEDEECGGHAKADDVGEGIELATKGAFLAAHAGEAAVEEIADAGDENAVDADKVGVGPVFAAGFALEGAVDDFEDGEEAEDEVAGGHQVGQQEDLSWVRVGALGGRAHDRRTDFNGITKFTELTEFY